DASVIDPGDGARRGEARERRDRDRAAKHTRNGTHVRETRSASRSLEKCDRCKSATMNAARTAYRGAPHARIFSRMQTTQTTQATQATQTKSTQWTLDPAHTTVLFSVRHLMITTVRGVFTRMTGTARYDAARPDDAELRVEIDAASVDTREAQRDAHL